MENIDELYELERECFGGSWTREMLEKELENPLTLLACERYGGKLVGFALGRVVVGEGELFQIGVNPDFRNRGIASRILEQLHDKMRGSGAEVCFLEVRSRNAAAIALYEKSGYKRISVRRGYYPDDDAIIMRKTL